MGWGEGSEIEARVELSIPDRLEGGTRYLVLDVEFEKGMEFYCMAQKLTEPDRFRTRHGSNPQPTRDRAGERSGFGSQFLRRSQHPLRLGQQALARGREDHAGRCAIEQRQTEFVLERPPVG